MDIPEIADARRLRFRPGDVLALRMDHCLDDAEFEGISAHLRRMLPDVKVLILDPGTEIAVLGPDDSAEDEAAKLTVQVDGGLDEQFWHWLRDSVRRRGGGDVQKALGT